MPYSPEQIQEMDILIRYNLESTHQTIKVHCSAHTETIQPAKSLNEKGLITHAEAMY